MIKVETSFILEDGTKLQNGDIIEFSFKDCLVKIKGRVVRLDDDSFSVDCSKEYLADMRHDIKYRNLDYVRWLSNGK